ncbi:MAG: CvpA family protein [Candidatus Azobacteroides sp.]|nr:CvpA family protein [Candidatus Azobacteroides sp.]
MNWLDIVIIVCIVIGIVHGLITGIVKQVISLISLVAAVFLSGAVANWMRNWMQSHIQNENSWFSPGVQNAIYYVLAFIIIVSVFAVLAKLADNVINYTPVGMINHLFGALFGTLMWALCLSIALNFLAVFDNQSQLITKPVKESSVYYEKVKMIFPTVFPYIKDFFKH